MARFLGIDAGLSGAIAVLDGSTYGRIKVHGVYDMPTILVRTGTKAKRREYDMAAIWRLLQTVTVGGVDLAVIERVQAFPGIGTRGVFSLGIGSGLLTMALTAAGVPFLAVLPVAWKRAYGLLRGDKGKSRMVAMQLFPEIVAELGKRSDEGRSEALLLALYAARQCQASERRNALD